MGVQDTAPRRVLLVDDEPENLEVLSVLLEDDFEIHVARSASEALTTFAAVGGFAVVISDQRMPGMTGVQLMTELRRLAPATVRMVLTAYSDLPPIVAAVNEGSVYRLFLKPWDHAEMRAAVADAVWIYEAQGALNRLVELLALRKRELASTLSQLRRSQNELLASERMSTLGRFAAGITHNIRNSLTVMVHLVDAVQRNPAAPRLLVAADHAFRTLDALLRVANDVGALARGRMEVARVTPVAMRTFLGGVVAAFAQDSLGRNRSLSFAIAPGVVTLPLDEGRMQKALLALLRSAANASASEAPLTINVPAPSTPGEACIEVFAAWKLDDSRHAAPISPASAELTLGLEVSRVVAEAHGGRLLEIARPDGGFGLELWLANPEAARP
jgi:CheY-like chemotaxis protein